MIKKLETFRHHLLDACYNVLAIGVFAQGRETGSDAPDQHLPLLLIARFQNLLHHIVGVLVLHHPLHHEVNHNMTTNDNDILIHTYCQWKEPRKQREEKSTDQESIISVSLLDDLVDKEVSVGGASALETLLDHVGCILVLAHAHNLPCQLHYYLIPLLFLPLLKHMLPSNKCTHTISNIIQFIVL
jgi:hypothetical protein